MIDEKERSTQMIRLKDGKWEYLIIYSRGGGGELKDRHFCPDEDPPPGPDVSRLEGAWVAVYTSAASGAMWNAFPALCGLSLDMSTLAL